MLQIEQTNYFQNIYQSTPFNTDNNPIYIDIFGTFESEGGFHFQQIAQADAVHFVSAGSGTIVHNQTTCTAKSGDLFILRKGEFYEYFDDASAPWKYTYFHFNGTQAGRLLDQIGLRKPLPLLHVSLRHSLCSEINLLRQQYEQEAMNEYTSISRAWNLLEQLEAASGNDRPEMHNPATAAKQLIDQSPQCISNVDTLAEHLNINRTTLFRHFKTSYGISVKQYIEEVRFNRILELVKNTELPISRIAKIGGFSDPLYFSRAFRTRFKTSPSEMRNYHIYPENTQNL